MNERQNVVTDKFNPPTFFVFMCFGRWITFVSVAVVIVSSLEDSIIAMKTLTRLFLLSSHRVDFKNLIAAKTCEFHVFA